MRKELKIKLFELKLKPVTDVRKDLMDLELSKVNFVLHMINAGTVS